MEDEKDRNCCWSVNGCSYHDLPTKTHFGVGGVVRTQKGTVISKEGKGLRKIQNKRKGKKGATTKLF